VSLPRPSHWILGLALSLAVAWAAGVVFLDTVQPMAFDPAIGRYVPAPGTTSRTRAEGWASSLVGEHGIRGLPNARLPHGQKVVFWGDSYVEALQVDDSERMAQVFSRLAGLAGMELCGVGVGRGGDVFADGIFRLADYAQALSPVTFNVFVLSRIDDTLPGAPRPCRARFLDAPLRLEPRDCPPSDVALRLAPLFRRLELAAVFMAYRRGAEHTLRLLPGPVQQDMPAQQTSALTPPGRDAAWDFLLRYLRDRSRAPLLLAYLPNLPLPRRGGVEKANAEEATATAFAQACQRNAMPFLDLGPRFVAHYQATGRFPRGFFNSPPGQGHLNEDGHRLVAEAVIQYIQEHRDALLAR